jgi:hypothetical protein
MSTPMDVDPPAAVPAETPAESSKGKGKEEKPRFEVKKVLFLLFIISSLSSAHIFYFLGIIIVECRSSLGLG